ncbi:hypothetical protein D4R20_02155 [bacterium]|nr:MAG: hypothetical protein D4R20_02155 [bacterium]
MGMGEPFLNYNNVLKSLKILTDPKGFGLSSRRITVSTIGFKGKIKIFADDLSKVSNKSLKNVKLALSLHSTNNGFREKIIPVSGRNRLPEIYDELVYFYRKTGTKITYEYIYFEGINDKPEDIKRLKRLSGMIPCNFNIIPFHPIGFLMDTPLDTFNPVLKIGNKNSVSNEKIIDFIYSLRSHNIVANLRTSSGEDINAACGQLALKE